jgi:ubiquinol-cytochrome c reductase cytochrome b subunit
MGCSVCHYHTGTPGGDIKIGNSSGFDLGGFASREWLAGFLDPKQINGPKYFGNTAFKSGEMANFLKEEFDIDDEEELEFVKEEYQSIAMALSAEAKLPSQTEADKENADLIDEGRELIADRCTECHKFGDEGHLGSAPDLTGYGSVEWLTGILANPAHERFYPDTNDGMPAYESFSNDTPEERARRIQVLAHWLRGEPAPEPNPVEQ